MAVGTHSCGQKCTYTYQGFKCHGNLGQSIFFYFFFFSGEEQLYICNRKIICCPEFSFIWGFLKLEKRSKLYTNGQKDTYSTATIWMNVP